jgi:hypothetical protein
VIRGEFHATTAVRPAAASDGLSSMSCRRGPSVRISGRLAICAWIDLAEARLREAEIHHELPRSSRCWAMHTAKGSQEPEHDEDQDNQAKDAAKASAAISVIAVVSTAAAQQKKNHDDNQNRTYCRLLGSDFESTLSACA